MKKFLISFILGLVLVSAGGVMLAFEISDFEIVEKDSDIFEEFVDFQDFEFDVSQNGMALEISDELEEYPIQYEYDESMLGKVRIEIPSYIDYRMQNNTLILDDVHETHFEITNFNEVKQVLDVFLEGLKQKKIYVMNDYDKFFIKVVCAKEERYKVTVKHTYE